MIGIKIKLILLQLHYQWVKKYVCGYTKLLINC